MEKRCTFEEIMEYCPSNRMVYNEIVGQAKGLVPFAGAGLSAFAYSGWSKTLYDLAGYITKPADRKAIRTLLKTDPLAAAQELESIRGEANLECDLAEQFSPDKLEREMHKLPRQAAYLLPLLFPSAITTNYDTVLERAYREQGLSFDVVLTPGHAEKIERVFGQGQQGRGLYKIHGDISGGVPEYASLIFTQKQYGHWYHEGTSLMKELKTCFQKRQMLFLGCSLQKDWTLNFLRKVTGPGMQHYAILECKKSELDKRANELGGSQNKGTHIRAIFYSGQKHGHEAVRVILEKLLEDTDPRTYQELPYHVGALPKPPSNRFAYDAGLIQLRGREAELEDLRGFCGDTRTVPLRWWAVTGPGGAGKSRLVYELSEERKKAGWQVHYLKRAEYADLKQISGSFRKKALVVVDYAQAYAREIGQWLELLLEKPLCVPVRVLLVERSDSKEPGKPLWMEQLYSGTRQKRRLQDSRYREQDLELKPMSQDALQEMMREYACEAGKKELPDPQTLFETLERVDKGLCRPLYALFITDAWMNGKSPKHWNQREVLDYMVDREQGLLKKNVMQLLGGKYDKYLTESLEQVRWLATVWGDAGLEELQRNMPGLWDKAARKLETLPSAADSMEDLLRQAGLCTGTTVCAMRPDLLGEYMVYCYAASNAKASGLLPIIWEEEERAVMFIHRLMLDYSQQLNEKPGLWKQFLSVSDPKTKLYYYILVNATALCADTDIVQSSISILRKRYEESHERGAAVLYAKGLFNLSCDQPLEGSSGTVGLLKGLCHQYPGNAGIAQAYAKGLFNLSNRQPLEERSGTVDLLKGLCKQYPGDAIIAQSHAQGLVNLSNRQPLEERSGTVDLLKGLCKQYPGDATIAQAYAKGLFNLSNKQPLEERSGTVDLLKSLCHQYPGDAGIAQSYAKGLFNLSCDQPLEGSSGTVGLLKGLCHQYPGNAGIAQEYAKGLFNLSNKQPLEERSGTVDLLKGLCHEYPKDAGIAQAYARGLFNLSAQQPLEERSGTVDLLKSLCHQYPGDAGIAQAYAKGLVNLSTQQPLEESSGTIELLKSLCNQYPSDTDLADVYKIGLDYLEQREREKEEP